MRWRKLFDKISFVGNNKIEGATQNRFFQWISDLEEEGISVENFEYLFSLNKNITFPISVEVFFTQLLVEDANGKKFELNYSNKADISQFYITETTNMFEVESTYRLTPEEIEIIDETYTPKGSTVLDNERKVQFHYDEQETSVELQKGYEYKLHIKYQCQDQNVNEKVLKYLWNYANDDSNAFNDVLSVFAYMLQILKRCHNISIKTFYSDDEENDIIPLSRIDMHENVVLKYFYTKTIKQTITCLYQMKMYMSVKLFMSIQMNR